VATPLHWEELSDRRLDPQGWTITTIAERLADVGDPWQGMSGHARGLGPARRALERPYA
jgi:DNA primase